jgi:tyrosine-protein kinase Etk/Wzc
MPMGSIILVTSPSPGDGKTTCVLSLAAMLAVDGKQVLVIDADVRKPTHHLLTGLPLEPGLQGLLAGKSDEQRAAGQDGPSSRLVTWRDVVHSAELSFGRFHSISAGTGARADLLAKRSFASLLERARSRYDFVLLDSPSYPLVSDALILAPLSDLVLTVVRLGNTPRLLAERHVQGIFPVARGHAALINDAERASEYRYYPAAVERAAASGGRIGVIAANRERLL